jgi:four helix bundle protein
MPKGKQQSVLVAARLLCMNTDTQSSTAKPYDIHERLLDFACDIVRTAQYLHRRGPIARALSYQLLSAGTSAGANAEEADGATSHDDFIAKARIALREAKETRFRLRVCRRVGLLDEAHDALIDESDQLVRILAKIVHNALRRRAVSSPPKRPR